MARKILTTSLNKEGKGTIGMIVPDFVLSSTYEDESKFYLFKLKLRRRLYWLRFKVELLVTKLSLKHRFAKKTLDNLTKVCNDLANDTLLEHVEDFKPEVILSDSAIDWRMKAYETFKKSIDEAKPIMCVDLSEEK